MAFFEASDDVILLHRLAAAIAPRARRMVALYLRRGGEEAIPPPADLRPAREAASREEALATLNATSDFPLLQVMARAIGRRIEALEIVASADFPAGARVRVPDRVAFPPSQRRVEGTVEATGTNLTVLLDNGETWSGPPSLAERAG
jgi:hypothetical protein